MNDITIDKTGWKKWRFDEFAQNISERVEPLQTDMDVYVGLEHIDPDTLHLSRHGHPSDIEGTKLRFYKGDIIFGRRRAYQRKTALATTEVILTYSSRQCSRLPSCSAFSNLKVSFDWFSFDFIALRT